MKIIYIGLVLSEIFLHKVSVKFLFSSPEPKAHR